MLPRLKSILRPTKDGTKSDNTGKERLKRTLEEDQVATKTELCEINLLKNLDSLFEGLDPEKLSASKEKIIETAVRFLKKYKIDIKLISQDKNNLIILIGLMDQWLLATSPKNNQPNSLPLADLKKLLNRFKFWCIQTVNGNQQQISKLIVDRANQNPTISITNENEVETVHTLSHPKKDQVFVPSILDDQSGNQTIKTHNQRYFDVVKEYKNADLSVYLWEKKFWNFKIPAVEILERYPNRPGFYMISRSKLENYLEKNKNSHLSALLPRLEGGEQIVFEIKVLNLSAEDLKNILGAVCFNIDPGAGLENTVCIPKTGIDIPNLEHEINHAIEYGLIYNKSYGRGINEAVTEATITSPADYPAQREILDLIKQQNPELYEEIVRANFETGVTPELLKAVFNSCGSTGLNIFLYLLPNNRHNTLEPDKRILMPPAQAYLNLNRQGNPVIDQYLPAIREQTGYRPLSAEEFIKRPSLFKRVKKISQIFNTAVSLAVDIEGFQEIFAEFFVFDTSAYQTYLEALDSKDIDKIYNALLSLYRQRVVRIASVFDVTKLDNNGDITRHYSAVEDINKDIKFEYGELFQEIEQRMKTVLGYLENNNLAEAKAALHELRFYPPQSFTEQNLPTKKENRFNALYTKGDRDRLTQIMQDSKFLDLFIPRIQNINDMFNSLVSKLQQVNPIRNNHKKIEITDPETGITKNTHSQAELLDNLFFMLSSDLQDIGKFLGSFEQKYPGKQIESVLGSQFADRVKIFLECAEFVISNIQTKEQITQVGSNFVEDLKTEGRLLTGYINSLKYHGLFDIPWYTD